MENVIQSAVTPTLKIIVEKELGARAEWTLCLDYRALALIEKETGLDLKTPKGWDALTTSTNLPTVVWCGLRRYSPEVTKEEVLDGLNPEAHHILRAKLLEMTYPDVAEALKRPADPRPNASADP